MGFPDTALSFLIYPLGRKVTRTPISCQEARKVTRRSGVLGEEGFDPVEFVFGETELGRPDYAIDLVWPPPADDGRGDGGVAQGPGDGDLARRPAVSLPDLAQQLDQFQVLREPRLLEVRVVAAPVVGGEILDALWGQIGRAHV